MNFSFWGRIRRPRLPEKALCLIPEAVACAEYQTSERIEVMRIPFQYHLVLSPRRSKLQPEKCFFRNTQNILSVEVLEIKLRITERAVIYLSLIHI